MKQDHFYKKLLPLALPMAFQQLMQSLVSASDALMMGMIDQASLSAVSLATRIAFVVSLFIFGLTGGGSILAAQYWGKESRDDVEQVFGILMRPMFLVGAVFTASSLLVPHLLMRIFTPDPELIRLGCVYLRSVSFSFVLMCIDQTYLCIMRNSGKAILASAISSVSVVLNQNLLFSDIKSNGAFAEAMGDAFSKVGDVVSVEVPIGLMKMVVLEISR